MTQNRAWLSEALEEYGESIHTQLFNEIVEALDATERRAIAAETQLKAWKELVTVAHVDRDKLWPNNWPQDVSWVAHCLHSKSIPPLASD